MTTKKAPVERDAKGRIVSGAANPGGLTSEQRTARDAMNGWLCAAPQVEVLQASYLALLTEKNPVITKDCMDRVAGKVKEHVEVSGDTERPLAGLTAEAIIAALKGKP